MLSLTSRIIFFRGMVNHFNDIKINYVVSILIPKILHASDVVTISQNLHICLCSLYTTKNYQTEQSPCKC
jgi:hypothetical protein